MNKNNKARLSESEKDEIIKLYKTGKYTAKELHEKVRDVKPDKIGLIRDAFKKEGYELLTKEYNRGNVKLDYVCSKHGKKSITWYKFKSGARCYDCVLEKKYSNVSRRLSSNEIVKLKEMYATGKYTKKELAKIFGCESYYIVNKYLGPDIKNTEHLLPKSEIESMRYRFIHRLVKIKELMSEYSLSYKEVHMYLKGADKEKEELDRKEIISIFNKKNYEVLEIDYKGYNSVVYYKCPIHGMQETIWKRFKKGSGCPECFNHQKPSLSERIAFFNNAGLELISKEYKNNKTKLVYNCPIHGEGVTTWKKVQASVTGYRCPKCYNLNGAYNPTMAERNKKEWKNVKAKLYFIKLSSKKEEFLKIGITVQSLHKRFHGFDYKVDILAVSFMNLYDAVNLENYIISNYANNEKYSYETKKKFGGYTECLNINSLSRVKKTLLSKSKRIISSYKCKEGPVKVSFLFSPYNFFIGKFCWLY